MTAGEVLIAEDDLELRALVARALEAEGFTVRTVETAAALMESVARKAPDVLVLDIGLPDSDGRDACQALRARGIQTPVLFLTARDAVPDRVAGFAAGGDDYVVKPFDLDELSARLRALLRRAGTDQRIIAGTLELDPTTHAAGDAQHSVALTPTEYRLMGLLASRHGEAVRRRELLVAGWGAGAIVHDNTLDVYIARLRRKLGSLETTTSIETVHGVGYLLR